MSILKRFRTRREAAGTDQPFDERLSAPTGPLSEKVSEISNRIEASRAQGDAAAKPAGSTIRKRVRDGLAPPDAPTGDAPQGPDGTIDPETPRVRALGFHKPIYQPTDPEPATHPDFKASTEPPAFKIFDAPDGVMENSGAPEKRMTAPKQKVAEPFDLDVFAKHLRATLPKKPTDDSAPASDPRAADTSGGTNAPGETSPEAQAAQFKQHFQARLQKAASASAFVPYHAMTPPRADPQPTGAHKLRLREATAHSALQTWRELQSSAKPAAADPEPPASPEVDDTDDPILAADPPPPTGTTDAAVRTDPADRLPGPKDPAEPDAPQGPQGTDPPRPVTWPEFPQDEFESPVPHSPDPYLARDAADQDQPDVTETLREPEPDLPPVAPPDPAEAPEYQPETLEEFEPAPDTQPVEPAEPPAPPYDAAPAPDALAAGPRPSIEEPQAETDNIFAALDLDEDEILMKVYDLIQAELQASWGENITLNIRRMVRAEVHAAVMRARSGL